MFELARRNRNRSIWLVLLMVLLLLAVGFAAGELLAAGGGWLGLAVAVVLSIILFLVAYYQGSAVLLASAGAREIQKKDAPQLYNVVEEMVLASGLGCMPKVYVIENNVANAFATGRDPQTAAVAVTEGLLNLCNREELQAVLGHEIAHVRNRDILFMTLLSVMAGSIALISDVVMRHWFWTGGRRRSRSSSGRGGGQAEMVILLVGICLIVFGTLAARLVYFAASRSREYLADAGSVIFTRNPLGLAHALEKLSTQSGKLPVPRVAQAMLIVGPRLFSSHPPIQHRIEILRRLAGVPTLSYQRYADAFRLVTGKRAAFVPGPALKEASVEATPGRLETPTGTAIRAVATAAAPFNYRREALDALKKGSGWQFHECPCGARIKVPAEYPEDRPVRCPMCGRDPARGDAD